MDGRKRMKLLVLMLVVLVSGAAEAHGTRVRSYTTRRGTHVSSHHRSSANHTKRDNYSTKGNVNPYTGKRGTKNP